MDLPASNASCNFMCQPRHHVPEGLGIGRDDLGALRKGDFHPNILLADNALRGSNRADEPAGQKT